MTILKTNAVHPEHPDNPVKFSFQTRTQSYETVLLFDVAVGLVGECRVRASCAAFAAAGG
jgi:hypothetical protein